MSTICLGDFYTSYFLQKKFVKKSKNYIIWIDEESNHFDLRMVVVIKIQVAFLIRLRLNLDV